MNKQIKKGKFDKEYSTQWWKETDYLFEHGIKPIHKKMIDEILTYKYERNSELFYALGDFYKSINK